MNKRLKHNLKVQSIYTFMVYILLLSFGMGIKSIFLSILIAFLFGLLNDIIIQLRKINGEKFDGID